MNRSLQLCMNRIDEQFCRFDAKKAVYDELVTAFRARLSFFNPCSILSLLVYRFTACSPFYSTSVAECSIINTTEPAKCCREAVRSPLAFCSTMKATMLTLLGLRLQCEKSTLSNYNWIFSTKNMADVSSIAICHIIWLCTSKRIHSYPKQSRHKEICVASGRTLVRVKLLM